MLTLFLRKFVQWNNNHIAINTDIDVIKHFLHFIHITDKVREANGCVLVHCLAGISRSPTLAIAYIMNQLSISSDEAYRYAVVAINFSHFRNCEETYKSVLSKLLNACQKLC